MTVATSVSVLPTTSPTLKKGADKATELNTNNIKTKK